jgi:hypothetical protein
MQIGIVVGIMNIRQIFDESSYRGVEGGILEGFGKLFPDNTRLLVYPEVDRSGEYVDYRSITLPSNLQYLYQHLLENDFIFGIECSDPELFKIYSREILKQLAEGRGAWEANLPEGVAEEIITRRLFDYRD